MSPSKLISTSYTHTHPFIYLTPIRLSKHLPLLNHFFQTTTTIPHLSTTSLPIQLKPKSIPPNTTPSQQCPPAQAPTAQPPPTAAARPPHPPPHPKHPHPTPIPHHRGKYKSTTVAPRTERTPTSVAKTTRRVSILGRAGRVVVGRGRGGRGGRLGRGIGGEGSGDWISLLPTDPL